MRNADAMNNYAEAKEALRKIFRQLERINPSAARSLEEGLQETLTVHRLGVGAVSRRKLATTNPIKSSLTNSFRHTAREFDSETSLYFMRARYYDPAAGRFLSEDPTGFFSSKSSVNPT
jgi:RHS repeat-associated protein